MSGDMYDFVAGTWNPMLGECSHGCVYCYVTCKLKKRWQALAMRYSGPLRVASRNTKPKKGKVFLCSCNDLFQATATDGMVVQVINLANQFSPSTEWLVQTKNPERVPAFLDKFKWPCEVGTTIETDHFAFADALSKAPSVRRRRDGMRFLSDAGVKTFVTVEPIVDFSSGLEFSRFLEATGTKRVNIGADTRRPSERNLTEPDGIKVRNLVNSLREIGIEVHLKSNLRRIHREERA